ncbi:hypothetical protein [Leadbetterella byssophila]|uniref:hypothetical protein n=1 Tax=Leadbetterella byssophila TaxID=316068 RepID=UPI0005A262E7|nr:hypothetical protein [Leadbetterella byssophila]
MTSLRKQLRKAGYDLIDGPVRNHKPLQLWLKPLFKQAELYYSDLNHAFDSPVTLVEEFDPALTVDSTKKR